MNDAGCRRWVAGCRMNGARVNVQGMGARSNAAWQTYRIHARKIQAKSNTENVQKSMHNLHPVPRLDYYDFKSKYLKYSCNL